MKQIASILLQFHSDFYNSRMNKHSVQKFLYVHEKYVVLYNKTVYKFYQLTNPQPKNKS